MRHLTQRLSAALADRYRIERVLGRGGAATVFLAEDSRHNRRVALKVLDPDVAAAIGPERFLREIAHVAELIHPNIVPLFDSGVADGLLFYVMPYVDGGSLRDRLTREKRLPVDDALRIAREVADALACAHAHGLVHRDIKPENILLESGHAVLVDFGIARAVAAAGADNLTATGIVVGTPAYMSPEQAAASRGVDGRSDLYSLACVLYEMLTGAPPSAHRTTHDPAREHVGFTPRPVTELRPEAPPSVAAALERALAREPADRFDSIARFGEALGRREGSPGSAAVRKPGTASRRPHAGRWIAASAVVALAAAAALAALWTAHGQRASPPSVLPARVDAQAGVAVLPFQNLSAGGPNAYLAGGLHQELLAQLARVARLRVISRTSVMGYANTTKPLRQIAAELHVGSIVEGSVQVSAHRLRVHVQLIDVATDRPLWGETYDRTLDDVFAIQSDVARRIVDGVGATLASGESEALQRAPTRSPEAYRLYLQGMVYLCRSGWQRENIARAQRCLEQSVALDPGFALAHAALSVAYGQLYWVGADRTPARAALQRTEAQAAFRLAPRLPQSHFALGMAHYWGGRDYRPAMRELRIALAGLPGDAEVWYYFAAVQRRMGNWAAVDSACRQAEWLDPRNANYPGDLGADTYFSTRRYAEAVRADDRAMVLAPDLPQLPVHKARVHVVWQGALDSLRAALAAVPPAADLGGNGPLAHERALLFLWEREPDSLLACLATVRDGLMAGQEFVEPTALYEAWAERLRGDEARAQGAFGRALATADSLCAVRPDDERLHAARGLALAGLHRRPEALREARWLQSSAVCRDDRFSGPNLRETRALVLAQADDAEGALDEIERLLAGPSRLSVHTLRLDPRWDPIRGHPRFRALLVRYADPEKWAVR